MIGFSILALVRAAPPFNLGGSVFPVQTPLNFACGRTAAPNLICSVNDMTEPQPVSHPVRVDLPPLRFWSETDLSGLTLQFRIYERDGTTVAVEVNSLPTGTGTKSDDTGAFFCDVDLSAGLSYNLTADPARNYSLRSLGSAPNRDALAYGPWVVFFVP